LGIMNAGSWVARRRPVFVETASARRASGPRFERFAAAMQAMPPPSAQVLPEAGDTAPGPGAEPVAAGVAAVRYSSADARPAPPDAAEHVRDEPQPAAATAAADSAKAAAAMPDAGGAAATTVPRRPVLEDGRRARGDVPWLGIGSWLLLCGALFASLVGWPDQTAVDRLKSVWSSGNLDGILARTPAQDDTTPGQTTLPPASEQDWSATTPGRTEKLDVQPPMQATPAAPSETTGDTAAPAEGPPLPRFKPRVDRVAAEFSSAFFEIGERLQQQGDFAAALHMRRQGSNLDPWGDGASDDERGPSG
jgi:cell division septation protein DedD